MGDGQFDGANLGLPARSLFLPGALQLTIQRLQPAAQPIEMFSYGPLHGGSLRPNCSGCQFKEGFNRSEAPAKAPAPSK